MEAAPILWLISAAAAVTAGLAVAAWRTERSRRAALGAETDRLRAALEAERVDGERRKKRREDAASELGELRRKLDKAKRRAFDAQERLAPLEAELETLRREGSRSAEALRKSEQEREHLEKRIEQLLAEASSLRAQREAAARREAVAERAAPPAAPPEELASLRGALAERETALARLVSKHEATEREAGRYRQRARTHQRLYMVIRGELEVAKDRLRALQGLPPASRPVPRAPDADEAVEA